MRGQLSAEMLILITVVLAIVAIAASQLLSTAEETATDIEESGEQLGKIADNTCTDDSDCQTYCDEIGEAGGECVYGTCRCE